MTVTLCTGKTGREGGMNNQSRETSLSNDPNFWGVGIVFEELEINFPTNICEDGFRRIFFKMLCK